FTMKPVRSDVRIGTLPRLAENVIASSRTEGDVVIVPTTSTSFISGTGLKKCKPMKRSTRFVAVIISVMISEDVLLAKVASGFNTQRPHTPERFPNPSIRNPAHQLSD